MTGSFSWDASTRILTTDDFTLGFWAANGVGFQLGLQDPLGTGVFFSGDPRHGEARMQGGSSMVKCTPEKGFEVWRVDAGFLNFGVTNDGDIRIRRTQPATSLGDVVRRLEIFDENGASIGFIPIYDLVS